jgi:antitoxin Phd
MRSCPVSSWPVNDAKARFSELLETTLAEGPQIVTKRGVETAVIVPIEQWRRLQERARPTLKELLLAPEPRFEGGLPYPQRGRLRRRKPEAFE